MAEMAQTESGDSHVDTFHCICNSLLFATTYSFSSLPRRTHPPALDKAHILPIPTTPRRLQKVLASGRSEDGDSEGSSSEDDDAEQVGRINSELAAQNHTILTGLRTSSSAILIRRSDGFEKRWLARCARCDLTVGYYLDWAQFASREHDASHTEGHGKKVKTGRREDVLYVLPGAVMDTQSMKEGKGGYAVEDVSQLALTGEV